MSLTNSTKEDSDNACEAKDLCNEEGGVGHEDKEGGLQGWKVSDVSELG